ncbi:MAG: KEOPS complex kinase/ATPase Bud32 [archaeon]
MIIARGAEAILRKEGNKLIKERVKKSYRLKEIDDKLRKLRTRQEGKLLEKVENGPKVFNVDDKNMIIEMEFIDGDLLKNVLDDLKNRDKVCLRIGENVARMHDKDIIHGDLTTSNMILRNNEVYFIDFGLGFISNKIEDKAVDLHLLRQALESKHYKHFKESFDNVLKGYRKSKDYEKVIERLKKVEGRGRYKKNDK